MVDDFIDDTEDLYWLDVKDTENTGSDKFRYLCCVLRFKRDEEVWPLWFPQKKEVGRYIKRVPINVGIQDRCKLW